MQVNIMKLDVAHQAPPATVGDNNFARYPLSGVGSSTTSGTKQTIGLMKFNIKCDGRILICLSARLIRCLERLNAASINECKQSWAYQASLCVKIVEKEMNTSVSYINASAQLNPHQALTYPSFLLHRKQIIAPVPKLEIMQEWRHMGMVFARSLKYFISSHCLSDYTANPPAISTEHTSANPLPTVTFITRHQRKPLTYLTNPHPTSYPRTTTSPPPIHFIR